MRALAVAVQVECALELLDRQPRVAASVRDLAEAGVRVRLDLVVGHLLEHPRVQALGELELVQPERDLGLEDGAVALTGVDAGGEVVLRDAEPAAQLTQELERGNPVARLDPRDVGGRAAGEGELALAEPGGLACGAEAVADGARVVYVC